MGKSKKGESSKVAKAATATTADATGFDPALAALFASSSGPVTIPQKSPGTKKASSVKPVADTDGILRTEANVDVNSEVGSDTTASSSAESSTEDEHEQEHEQSNERPRKRRKVDLNDDLESKYLNKLAKEEEQELKQRNKQQAPNAQDEDQEDSDTSDSDASDSDLNSDLQDISDSDAEPAESAGEDDEEEEEEDNTLPQHESLDASAHDVEEEKTSRSVFLGNVSTACIKSKSAKKALIHHLQTAISPAHHEKIESLRFRSTAFVADAGPKRAAYAKKELMDETMQSTNAYVVLSSQAAARKVAARLNGTVVLDRHLRADCLGSPAKVDHRRCVFVGNLSFVDEATAPETDGTGEGSKKRKRAKDPADVEEGLWRTFGKVGQVESVRVIRDKETRISKGFAYVQFTDENAVESALLMDGKKFPPMLPRLLRVSRAKKEMKRDQRAKMSNGSVPGKNIIPAARRDKAGRGKGPRRGTNGTAAGARVVLEGNRASSGSLPKGLKKLKKKPAVKPTNRSSKRAAAFRAGGGKKKRDMAP